MDATLLSAALDVEPDTTSCELAAITKQSRAGEDRVSAIVQALATSVSFTRRRRLRAGSSRCTSTWACT
jgi:hypothetical protein